jgi:AraC family transcriptional regulator
MPDRPLKTVETHLAASVTASSRAEHWNGIEVTVASIADRALDVDTLETHTLAINVGRPYRLQGRYEGRDASARMPTGAMKIVAAGPRSSWRWDAGEPLEVIHVSVGDDAVRAAAEELDVGGSPEVATHVGLVDPVLFDIGSSLAAELRADVRSLLAREALRIELLRRFLVRYSSAGRPALPPRAFGYATLRAIDAYVDANLAGDIRVAELAAIARMSSFHFVRSLRATAGVTPYHYVMERRLERAYALLRTGRSSILDVALATGFADQSHLTRLVKRRYGRTPGAIRGERAGSF